MKTIEFNTHSKLAEFVQTELSKHFKQDKRSISKIALSAQVPLPWLLLFTQGRIKNPGVERMERLYEFFSGKSLSI